MRQNPASHRSVLDDGQKSESSTAARTVQHVEPTPPTREALRRGLAEARRATEIERRRKASPHQLGPRVVRGVPGLRRRVGHGRRGAPPIGPGSRSRPTGCAWNSNDGPRRACRINRPRICCCRALGTRGAGCPSSSRRKPPKSSMRSGSLPRHVPGSSQPGPAIAGGLRVSTRVSAGLGLPTPGAGNLDADERAPSFRRHHPGAVLPRRLVAHVLSVTALELSHPVPLVVLMKAGDRPLRSGVATHPRALRAVARRRFETMVISLAAPCRSRPRAS